MENLKRKRKLTVARVRKFKANTSALYLFSTMINVNVVYITLMEIYLLFDIEFIFEEESNLLI